jgi:hypothetical protein
MVKQRILAGRIEPMTGAILLHTALGHVPRGPPAGCFPRWDRPMERHGTTYLTSKKTGGK